MTSEVARSDEKSTRGDVPTSPLPRRAPSCHGRATLLPPPPPLLPPPFPDAPRYAVRLDLLVPALIRGPAYASRTLRGCASHRPCPAMSRLILHRSMRAQAVHPARQGRAFIHMDSAPRKQQASVWRRFHHAPISASGVPAAPSAPAVTLNLDCATLMHWNRVPRRSGARWGPYRVPRPPRPPQQQHRGSRHAKIAARELQGPAWDLTASVPILHL